MIMMQNSNETEQALAAELRRLSDRVSDGGIDPAEDLARAQRSVRRSRIRLAGGSVLAVAALAVAIPFAAPAIGEVLPGNVNIRPAAYPTATPTPGEPSAKPKPGEPSAKPKPGEPSPSPEPTAKPTPGEPSGKPTPSEQPSSKPTPSEQPSSKPTPAEPSATPTPGEPSGKPTPSEQPSSTPTPR
jgi:hypothetical protein